MPVRFVREIALFAVVWDGPASAPRALPTPSSVWDALGGGAITLPGLAQRAPSEASDINGAGRVVGRAADDTGTSRAVACDVGAR